MAGGESPTPAGQPVLDIDSYLDPSVLDSSLLSFSGLRVEASAAPGALPGPGGGQGVLPHLGGPESEFSALLNRPLWDK